MQVGFDTLPHEVVVIDGRRQARQQLEPWGAGDAVADPGQVGVGHSQGLQHVRRVGDNPGGIGRVGIFAAQAQVGAQGHGVEVNRNLMAFGNREFLRRVAGEAVLRIDIETGDFHGGSPCWTSYIIYLVI